MKYIITFNSIQSNFSFLALILIPLLYYFFGSSLSQIYFTKQNHYLSPRIFFDQAKYQNLSIMVFSLLLTPTNISRIQQQYRYFGKDFRLLAPYSPFYVGFSAHIPGVDPVIRVNSLKDRSMINIHQLMYFYFEGLNYFLTKTRFRWFWRTTEDCFINYPKLLEFQNELESHYNTYEDTVIIGQVCEYSTIESLAFIHGGAGWILSRKAAQEFYNKRQFYYDYLSLPENNKTGDDVTTQFFMVQHNIKPSSMHNSKILSTKLDNKSVKALLANDYRNISKCPPNPKEFPITRRHIPMHELVAWHAGRNDVISIVEGFRILANVPKNIYVQYDHDYTTICINTSVQI